LNDNIVFIFDLGTAGDGSANSTYYFDDVSQSAVAVVSTAPTLPLDLNLQLYTLLILTEEW
jgi:hypothetical protein